MDSSLSAALVDLVQQSFEGKNRWHAPLVALVQDLTLEQALWRPAPERKCVWEIVRHIIFWREYLLCHVMGRPVPDAEANNWTLPAETSEQAWRAELERLRQVQQELLDWFTTRKPEDLLATDKQGKHARFLLEAGITCHDSYHAGQIATLRALMGLPPVE